MHESCIEDSVYVLSENTFKQSSLRGVKKESKIESIINIKEWWFAFIIPPLKVYTLEKS
jgi:hypothetical protein